MAIKKRVTQQTTNLDLLVCEDLCGAAGPGDGVEIRECGHVICEDCFCGCCPICEEEQEE